MSIDVNTRTMLKAVPHGCRGAGLQLLHLHLYIFFAGSLTFLLSMGRNDGVGQVKGYYVGRLLVSFVKSRDLFVSKSWKTMGQTMPS